MKNILLTTLLSSCFMTSVVAAKTITPKQNGNSGYLPSGQSDLVFRLSNGNWVGKAQDRDRVIFKSNAEWTADIKNDNTNTQATLKLRQGDRYEFMYVADQAHWVLMSSPEFVLKTLPDNKTLLQIPNMQVPTTRYTIEKSSKLNQINLPLKAQVGDKVILESDLVNDISITTSNGLNKLIKSGEKLRYVYTYNGWIQDTSTIDMLLVSSREVENILGFSAAKLRLYEGLELTNAGAENSNAQFYVRSVGYLTYTIPTKNHTLGDVLRDSRTDPTIQNERNRLNADAVYYEGTEDEVCGLAWLNKTPSSFNMIASGSISCDIKVMRHEFGHNMGVSHHDSNTIAQGFRHPLGSTILAGNNLPYYSSPNLYHPQYGYRLGEADKIDAVSLINKNAPLVAAFK